MPPFLWCDKLKAHLYIFRMRIEISFLHIKTRPAITHGCCHTKHLSHMTEILHHFPLLHVIENKKYEILNMTYNIILIL